MRSCATAATGPSIFPLQMARNELSSEPNSSDQIIFGVFGKIGTIGTVGRESDSMRPAGLLPGLLSGPAATRLTTPCSGQGLTGSNVHETRLVACGTAATGMLRLRGPPVGDSSIFPALRPQRYRKPGASDGFPGFSDVFKASAPRRTRTCNLRFRRPMLYPLS